MPLKNAMLVVFFLVLMPVSLEVTANAARAPKVVRSKGCEVRIRGGDFSIGDEAVFTFYRRGRDVPVLIKITEEKGDGRFVGQVMEAQKCDKVQGAKYSQVGTNTHLRDLFIYRQWLGIGYLNLSHEGMNVIGGKAGQSLPSLIIAQTRLELFPLASFRTGFFEQNVGLLGEFGSSIPLLGEWEFDDGGTINPNWMSYGFGIFARLYYAGSANPATVAAKFRHTSFTFDPASVVLYKKSLLRSLSCSGPFLSLDQIISVTSSLQLFGGVNGALGSSCSTPPISEAESLDFEQQQLEAGIARDEVLISTEVQSDETILAPSLYGFQLGFRWEIADQFATSLEYDLDFAKGELKLINTTRPIFIDSSSISLSIDLTFGEI